MKRIHYLLLGLLVSLTIAAVSPSLPPTRIAAGSNISVVTNGVNSFTISGPVTNVVFYGSSSNAITIPGTNSIGIGNAGPALAPIHVGDYTVNSSVGSKILVSENVDNSTPGVNAHAFSDSSILARSGGIGYNSFDARINIGGGVDYDHYAAFQSIPTSVQVGVMQNYYAHYDLMSISLGTLRNDYGFYKATSVASGGAVISNVFGVYVEPQAAGSLGNWAIYTAGTTRSAFGGNVGVGVDVPASAFGFSGRIAHVKGAEGSLRLQANSGADMELGADASSAFLVVNSASPLRFYNNGSESMRITSARDVGIGTSSPSAKLDVAGTVKIGSAGSVMQSVVSATAVLNYDLTLVDVEDLTITVTGAALGDTVSLGVPNGSVTTSVQYTGWVSATDTVTVRARTSVIGEDPASGTFRATVIKF